MANDLTYAEGLPLTLEFGKANVAENATTALTLVNGGAGLIVPAGYAFHPMLLFAEANATLSAGTATFVVTANTTSLGTGFSVALDANTQTGSDTQRPGVKPVAAGATIGVSVVADANYAANTLDLDAILVGVLLPA